MLVVFYDGECSFCTKRMWKLKKLDWNNRLTFEDVHDPGLILEFYGLDYDDAVKEIYAVQLTEDFEIVCTWKGINAIIAIYTLLGLKRGKILQWPIVYSFARLGYWIMNKIRWIVN